MSDKPTRFDRDREATGLKFEVEVILPGEHQTITMQGCIKTRIRWPSDPSRKLNAVSELDFKSLVFNSIVRPDSVEAPLYQHIHAVVVVDTNDEKTFVALDQPAYSVVTSSGALYERYLFEIRPHEAEGKVWIYYDVEDLKDRTHGMKLGSYGSEGEDERLPNITMKYWGIPPNQHPPPPQTLDVRIAAYWQLPDSARSTFEAQALPQYFNICQVLEIKMPTDLKEQKLYKAKIDPQGRINVLIPSDIDVKPSVLCIGGQVALKINAFTAKSGVPPRIGAPRTVVQPEDDDESPPVPPKDGDLWRR